MLRLETNVVMYMDDELEVVWRLRTLMLRERRRRESIPSSVAFGRQCHAAFVVPLKTESHQCLCNNILNCIK